MKHNAWRVVAIIFSALAILVGLSFLPLEKWSGGRISDFNIFSDILNIGLPEEKDMPGAFVDPCLAEAIEEDNRAIDTTQVAEDDKPLIAVQPVREGSQVVIEDYTESGRGLENLRKALAEGGMARIAVIGDSYIEGDIITQDLRELLQRKHGGNGVGYVNMHSEFPGFRRSVSQGGGSGWKEIAANGKFDERFMSLTQHYYKLNSKTTSTYSGSSKFSHTGSWNRSQFLFISPSDTEIEVETSSGTKLFTVTGSDSLQAITIDEPTSKFNVTTSTPGIIGLGVWLTDQSGINVDCMSSRGFSGVTLAKVNKDLSSQMSKFVDYDLIILEFGINAMSAGQKNFDGYRKRMEAVVKHMRECFPNADILLMGIGDRGAKRGTEVHSMSAAPYMTVAQREAARRSRCLFWDTREAMGGDDAIIRWVREKWANTDYIHLNHNGSIHLATPLFNAIELNLEK